jgi:hypothetical protein
MTDPIPWRFTCQNHPWAAAREPCPFGDGIDADPPVPDGRAAVEEIIRAATCGTDFGGWLAHVLAEAAARVGSSTALLSSRPGSWESHDVEQLLRGTVGWNDEHLGDWRREPREHPDGWEYGYRFDPANASSATMEGAADDRAQAEAQVARMRGTHPDWNPRLVRRRPVQPAGDWEEMPDV